MACIVYVYSATYFCSTTSIFSRLQLQVFFGYLPQVSREFSVSKTTRMIAAAMRLVQTAHVPQTYLALPRGAQWRPVSSVEISIGDPLEAAGMFRVLFMPLSRSDRPVSRLHAATAEAPEIVAASDRHMKPWSRSVHEDGQARDEVPQIRTF